MSNFFFIPKDPSTESGNALTGVPKFFHHKTKSRKRYIAICGIVFLVSDYQKRADP
ncbi:hypothetical protein NBRC111894_3529 [Sporolactobacillus inulinus]|uniref:Uncharacterized protein n=1 Tax=Sporolactobacillus inulinus TaxID=2078 RepID=A0A4Y1ZFU7_9BACL|nr:hypothetical protein NBRC111894_3529 [Sporolactobacillus inulinus]